MFWILQQPKPLVPEAVYGTIASGETLLFEITKCASCQQSRLGRQLRNIRLELYNTTLHDFVWIDSPEIIISEQAKNLFSTALTGISYRPIDIATWEIPDPVAQNRKDLLAENKELKLYQVIPGSQIVSLKEHNPLKNKFECTVCGLILYEPILNGFMLPDNLAQLGELFQLKEYPGYLVVTDKFAEIVQKNQFGNFDLTPIDKFSMR